MRLFGTYNGIEYYYTDKFLYAKRGSEFYKLALFDKHFYKLRLYARIPILEIDGIRMQPVKDFRTPMDFAKEVVRSLDIRSNDVVLDTCTGLGYAAIEASKTAKHVTTCELNRPVLQLAKWNPFSQELFHSKNIEIKQGDIASILPGQKEKSFDVIIHDPPRFSFAPQLYSSQFYREMMRICKKGAMIFHYVGSMGEHRGRSMEKQVSNRLEAVGFRDIRYLGRLQGLLFRR